MTCPVFDEDDISDANVLVIDVTEKTTRISAEEDLPDYYEDESGFEVCKNVDVATEFKLGNQM